MSQPSGCGIIFSPSQRIDRRNSLRRSFTTNSKTKRRTADEIPVASGRCNESFFSCHTHSRSLSDKMRHLQMRRARDQDAQQQPTGALRPAPNNVKRNPKHLDLLEAASQSDLTSVSRRSPQPCRDIGMGKENMAVGPRRMKVSPPNEQQTRQTAYDRYMKQAFGFGSSTPTLSNQQPMLKPPMPFRPESHASAMTADSMEVNFHMAIDDTPVPTVPSARDRRPKIQVQIPGKKTPVKRPTSSAHLVSQIDRQKSKRKVKHLEVSPPDGSHEVDTPARLSVVSPLSVMEMPKPRRPFSAWSLEDATKNEGNGAALQKTDTSSSDSSKDDRSSTYTKRSSMSSLTSVYTVQKPLSRRHSIAFSIADPTAAGVFDPAPPVPKIPTRVRAMKSSASLAINTNKPLPPEPGLEEVRPLRLPSQSYSRGSDLHPKRNPPTPLTISRSSTVSTIKPDRMSLRSKYTPADLDALDAAFVKSSPQVASFQHSREPSCEQAQSALEEHLGTIAEDDSASGIVPFTCDPLQISRVTNEMVPTRQAPAPPRTSSAASSYVKLSDGSNSSRKRLQKNSSKHLAMQMKGGERERSSSDLRLRISGPIGSGGNMAKANKILGKPATDIDPTLTGSIQMEREQSHESNWSSSDSPDTSYNGDSSSPVMSNRGDTTTPETEISDVPDHAFEEIKSRMALLSPENDSPVLGRILSAEPSPALPIQDQKRQKPAVERSPVPDVYVTPHEDNDEVAERIAAQLEAAMPPAYPFGPRLNPMQERPRSLASIAASEIPDLYASLPSDDLFGEDPESMISADAAELVLLRILEHLDNLQDLFATATVSRGFYRTFKRHELPLMKNALYGMSPAAWELREVTPPYPGLQMGGQSPRLDYAPAVYLQHYMRDMYTMIALKSMILIHCESFLRADTISALAGGETERASQIDDAFWRVWTFCKMFGSGSNREEDIVAQMDWLRGGSNAKKEKRNTVIKKGLVYAPDVTFGYGNADGLSAEELYDMTEIWTCMGVLVRGFQGKREEAREYGVFDNATDLAEGDVEAEDALLEEWTYHLLTLAPPVVLDVTSPTAPTATTFAHARSSGYTDWTPPSVSRSTFLKEAVSRVYQERIVETHSSSAPASPRKTSTPHSLSSTPDNSSSTSSSEEAPNETVAARWRCARHAAEIRAKRSEPGFDKLPPSEDRPMSNYPSVLEKLDGPQTTPDDAPAMPALPSTTTAFSITSEPCKPFTNIDNECNADPSPVIPQTGGPSKKASQQMTMIHTHKPTKSTSDTAKTVISALVVPRGPQVVDPVDVAVDRLVAMGFESRKAKKALADSDTGNSIDFDRALEMLVRERKRDVEGLMHQGYRGVGGAGSAGGVMERRKAFEGQSEGEREREGEKRPCLGAIGRTGSVKQMASSMEQRRTTANGGAVGVGLGIGGM